MLDRLLSFLVALSLAFLVWLYMRTRDPEMLDNVPVPVQVVLAPGQREDYELEVAGPNQVPVSFSGPPSRIRELRNLLRRGELLIEAVLTVPEDRLQDSRYQQTVRIEASDVHPPPGVIPFVIEGRNRIPVTLRRLAERRLPVRFEPVGEARITQVAVEPPSVLVRGPKEVLDRVRAIPTQPYALPADSEPASSQQIVTAESVPLVQELEGRRVWAMPGTVTARMILPPQQQLQELVDVPVRFLCPADFSLRPLFRDAGAGKITLRVLGPAGGKRPALIAYVDLTGRSWEPGCYEEPVHLQLPKDFQLAQSLPRLVAIRLVPADSGTKAAGVARHQ